MERPSIAFVQVGSSIPEEVLPWWETVKEYVRYLETSRKELAEAAFDAGSISRHEIPAGIAFMSKEAVDAAIQKRKDDLAAFLKERGIV